MGPQLELQLLPPTPKALNLCGYVHDAMRSGDWMTPYQIQRIVEQKTGEYHSDSSITARIRDLRKKQYGCTIESRPKLGARGSWEYRLLP